MTRPLPQGLIGYGTSGLTSHRLDDAAALLADLGYTAIAITPDVPHLDPRDAHDLPRVRKLLESHGLTAVVESGARYTLDRRRKHWPTLIDPEPDASRRRALLEAHIAIAAGIGAPLVSCWSGAAPAGDSDDAIWTRLVSGIRHLLDAAETSGVALAFEPEPGMFIDTLASYVELRDRLGDDASRLWTTIDLTHCLWERKQPHTLLASHAVLVPTIAQFQLDDGRMGEHTHLPLGDGELDLVGFARWMRTACSGVPLMAELSRDAHRGAAVAEATIRALRAAGLAPG
jgi:sugar phosphate isomerase/epimerase